MNELQTRPKQDIRTLLQSDRGKQQLALVLPKHLTADRMARVALTAVMRTPKLVQCTPESLLSCLMLLSQFGLEPDGRHAHLIPRENRKTRVVECTVVIDWKGLAALALRSGLIAKLHADLICDRDDFAFDLGDILHHRINWRESRGEPYAAYAMAITKTGERFVAVMTRDEIERIRDSSQGWQAFKQGFAKQTPWQDHPGEMWKKTAFRRLAKWLPLSPEFRDALDADDSTEAIAPQKVGISTSTPLFQIASPALPEPEAPQADAPSDQEAKTVYPEAKPAEPEPDDTDLGPQPAKPKIGRPIQNFPKAIRGLLKLAGHTEAELLDLLRTTGRIDDSVGSLEEMNMVASTTLKLVHDEWQDFDKELSKAKAAK